MSKIEWKPNAAGDLEAIVGDVRYRIESFYGVTWLYRKPLDLSAESDLVGSFLTEEEAMASVESGEMIGQ